MQNIATKNEVSKEVDMRSAANIKLRCDWPLLTAPVKGSFLAQ